MWVAEGKAQSPADFVVRSILTLARILTINNSLSKIERDVLPQCLRRVVNSPNLSKCHSKSHTIG